MAVDTLGHLLALRVTAANEQERAQVAALAEEVQLATGQSVELAYVDQGYTGETPAEAAEAHGIQLEVVKHTEAKRGFVLLPRRWVVERSFAWMARFRRLARDYERLSDTLAGMHFIAFTYLMLRRLLPELIQVHNTLYGARLVPEHLHGKAVTVIMAGNTLGISIGLPLMTTIGVTFGWRIEFMVLGLVVVGIVVLSYIYLPSVGGEKLTKSNSPLAALRNPALLIILLLTFLSVAAHYGIYTYITLLVELIGFAGGIGVAMLIFGIGSVISVIVSAKYIDAFLRPMIIVMLAIGGVSMAMLLAFRGTVGISHFAFFLWGLAFGPLVTMYQTAVIKRAEETKDVSTSVQSSVFNFSIMVATWMGGMLLTRFPDSGVKGIVYMSLVCFILATIIAYLSKRTLRSSSVAMPGGASHEEVHQRASLPAPH